MTLIELEEKFKQYGRTLGACESFTGGSFAAAVTSISGASAFFKGSLVTYATEEKIRILGVSENLIRTHGVVSAECAGEMAGHAKALLNTDYCVSFTGNAGPSAMENKPVGEIYIGVVCYETAKVYKYLLNGTRKEIQEQAIQLAIDLLAQELELRK